MQTQNDTMAWYTIKNIDAVDSPALVIYEERVRKNIQLAQELLPDNARLRPHVKTSKIAEVNQFMLEAGITKFKCATIAEGEMLAQIKAPDILLAYQPVGPKLQRLLQLIKAYPASRFSCLVDNTASAIAFSHTALAHSIVLDVYIDLNVGMNRTGILPGEAAFVLYKEVLALPGLRLLGLHAYDGHIKEVDPIVRQQQSDAAYAPAASLAQKVEQELKVKPIMIAGGSPTFPTHLHRGGVECSPGTFIFWDHGYKLQMPELPFDYAALVISRVISIIDDTTICTDLGHKSVAAENPHPRVYFLNAPDAVAVGQSEEHMVLKVADAHAYKVGDVLYGAPMHVCPTVALYDRGIVINDHQAAGEWRVVARDRKITV
ncbi:D-TA family PLP-dependent enzyme [Paraflavitalea sp. CAU 1676]|uniref:D-TA family PLP-dependent enzyme n=1 Tax=Paraflavitalea sp. CAU 1676 TaxID=3032598 RepID=UPI0023D97ED6|nr:D-TA family PLP-dependent enzyme [Paraflavitalea sp. CAU 1676]MDF2190646.1 D-TA family PLP-dependent enzyme [Paraflavitalea sp. CAU 1676]